MKFRAKHAVNGGVIQIMRVELTHLDGVSPELHSQHTETVYL